MATDPDDRTLQGPPEAASAPSTPSAPSATPATQPGLETTIKRQIAPAERMPDLGDVQLEAEGRYEPLQLLGLGGVGEVWLVHDRQIAREVAVKRLRGHEPSPAAVDRFLLEARLQGQLEHPAVVPVHDLATSPDGKPYFVMRRVRGQTLRTLLASQGGPEATRYSRRRLLTAFSSVCLAVHYAHTRGVVHRDLKPDNIMLGDFGEVYVLDWGLAKRAAGASAPEDAAGLPPGADADATPDLTVQGQLMGTPAYMAPEQIRGGAVDARTDVYALGVILYELLTRRRRHTSTATEDILKATLEGPWEPPSARAADVPPELDAACARALAREPAERYASARDLADAVDRFLDGDRDLEQRRSLASTHAQRADAALGRLRAAPAEHPARLEAMREVLAALALDPEQAEAREALVRLLVEVPDHLPPEAEADLADSNRRARLHGLRSGLLIYASWLACIGYALFMGVRSWAPVLATSAAVVTTAALCGWLWWKQRVGKLEALLLAGATLLCVAGFSCWLGPFVLVPVASASCTLIFAAQVEAAERRAIVAMGVVASLLPYLAEWSGLVPPGYAFEGDRLVLLARAVELHPSKTLFALVYTSAAFTFFPAYAVGQVRDALVAAERRLFLHAWHFGQLAKALSGR